MKRLAVACLAIVALGILAAPLAAEAQPGRSHRIGLLVHGSPPDWAESLAAFRQRLRMR